MEHKRKKYKIGIDIDEVLIEFARGFCDYHNEKYGTKLTLSSFFTYKFHLVLKIPQEECTARVNDFFTTDFFTNLSPVDGAVQAIRILSKDYDLPVITSRPLFLRDQTNHYLDQYFPGMLSDRYFSSSYYHNSGGPLSKPALCKQLCADVIVEDSIDYALQCAEFGIAVILFDRPWNQGPLPKGVTRFYNWPQIVEFIRSKKEK